MSLNYFEIYSIVAQEILPADTAKFEVKRKIARIVFCIKLFFE